jgi:hypothetical protein
LRILTGDTSNSHRILSDGVFFRAEDEERGGVPRLFPLPFVQAEAEPDGYAAVWPS